MAVSFDELCQRLKEERQHLSKSLEQLRASAPPVGEPKEGSPYGKKEEGAAEACELENRLALEERLRRLLSEVEHALQKFEDGTYGLCDVCGQPIDRERLEVFPRGSLCLGCKAREAKNGRRKFLSR